MGMPKDYSELVELRRGSEIIYKHQRTRCVVICRMGSGGLGMGEFPARVIAAFENGLVIGSDEWVKKVYVIEKPFKEATPDF